MRTGAGRFRRPGFGSHVRRDDHHFPGIVGGVGYPIYNCRGFSDAAHRDAGGNAGTSGFRGESHLAGVADLRAANGAHVGRVVGGGSQTCEGVERVGDWSPGDLVKVRHTAAAENLPCGLVLAGSP